MPSQVRLGLDPAPGDANRDAPPVQVAAALRLVVALVRVQLLRSAMGSSWVPSAAVHRRASLQTRLEELAVVDIGC